MRGWSTGGQAGEGKRVVFVAVLAAAVVAGSEAADAAGPGDSLSFRASVTPRTHLFGDPVTAEVQAVAPSAAAAGMKIKTDFAPYVIVGPVEVERAPAGANTEVRLALASRVPHARLPPGRDAASRRLRAGEDHGPGRRADEIATATWPIVIVRSRLGPEDRARPEQRASIYPVGGADPTDRAGDAGADALGLRRSWCPRGDGAAVAVRAPYPRSAPWLRAARLRRAGARPHAPCGGS